MLFFIQSAVCNINFLATMHLVFCAWYKLIVKSTFVLHVLLCGFLNGLDKFVLTGVSGKLCKWASLISKWQFVNCS